ncbi:MAG: hypothetical protein ACEQSX_08210 [Baekduiaceae bacterium]
MESDFAEMLPTRVIVSTGGPASRTLHGVEAFDGNGSTFFAYYEEKRAEVRTGSGAVVAQRGVLYLDSTVAFSTSCRVTLPAELSTSRSSYPVVLSESYPDGAGFYGKVLHLGM